MGIALLPKGKRRDGLASVAERMLQEDFKGLCLPYEEVAALEYSLLVAARMASGKPISTENAQIAAIAICHQLVLVTRKPKDFLAISKLELCNPWDAP